MNSSYLSLVTKIHQFPVVDICSVPGLQTKQRRKPFFQFDNFHHT